MVCVLSQVTFHGQGFFALVCALVPLIGLRGDLLPVSGHPHKKISNLMERRPEKSRNHPQAQTIRPASFLHYTRTGKRSRHQSPLRDSRLQTRNPHATLPARQRRSAPKNRRQNPQSPAVLAPVAAGGDTVSPKKEKGRNKISPLTS